MLEACLEKLKASTETGQEPRRPKAGCHGGNWSGEIEGHRFIGKSRSDKGHNGAARSQ
jgi:hypothetical protein